MLSRVCQAALCITALSCAAGATAQAYPSHAVRMVVSGIAGSSNFAARLIA